MQSDNQETLSSIKRRNLEEQQIGEALAWATEKEIESTAQFIFGLPNETRESFAEMLKRAYQRGFDNIHVGNLLLFNGAVLNRQAERKQYGFKTKFRAQGPSYAEIEGRFAAETSEVVVSSASFSFEDYLAIRRLTFMIFTIGLPGFYKLFFRGLESLGVDSFDFMERFLSPEAGPDWPQAYLSFLADLDAAFCDELYDSADAVKDRLRMQYRQTGGTVSAPTAVNVLYAARLIYMEQPWHEEVFNRHLRAFDIGPHRPELWDIAQDLLNVSRQERIPLRRPRQPEPLAVNHDLALWQQQGARAPIQEYRLPSPAVTFMLQPGTQRRLDAFNGECAHLGDGNYYYNALMRIKPRSLLRCPFTLARGRTAGRQRAGDLAASGP